MDRKKRLGRQAGSLTLGAGGATTVVWLATQAGIDMPMEVALFVVGAVAWFVGLVTDR